MLFRSGELNESEEQLFEAVRLSEKYNIITYMGTIYNRFGSINYLRGNMDRAVKDYEKSINYHQKIGDFIEATRPINNLANIYAEHYVNIDKAMENYKKGLEISRKFGIQEVEIVFLINISNIYADRYDFDKALQYLEEAKKGALELQDLNNYFSTYVDRKSTRLNSSH